MMRRDTSDALAGLRLLTVEEVAASADEGGDGQ